MDKFALVIPLQLIFSLSIQVPSLIIANIYTILVKLTNRN